MREGAKGGVVHLAQQLAEGRVAGQVRAQDERVDEQADEALELRAGAARDGSADGEVVLTGVALEQDVERRQEHGEQRAALAQAQLLEPLGERRGQDDGVASPLDVHGRGARTVRGQLQHRVRIQPLAPVRQLRFERVPLRSLSLPRGIVRVLQGQGRQGRRLAGREGLVQLRHLADQHAHGPAVGHDVVDRDEQQVHVRGEPVAHRAKQRPPLQVERHADVLAHTAQGLGFTLVLRQAPQVHLRDGQLQVRSDLLERPALVLREGGAQRVVAVHDGLEGPGERHRVELPGEAHGDGHVERRVAGRQPLLQPHALLPEGGGHAGGRTDLSTQQFGQPRALVIRGEGHVGASSFVSHGRAPTPPVERRLPEVRDDVNWAPAMSSN
ncbi:hypothetical protein ASNO1_62770 [Corallococcus caeni]|uniref:Uncharacterized protein n=1 Tax=Corallococcus caeni TaxID=3082388 RepID=A0ABQ6R155_9BACT|nr:hypothetical protein ASNO1_62770 [Corallococcus sp. NO1]